MTEKPEPALTPTQLLALAERLEREAEALTARAKRIREAVETIERLGDLAPASHTALRPAFPGPLHGAPPPRNSLLPSRPQSDTNSPMSASAIAKQIEPATRTRGRDITSDGPVAVVAKKLGLSIKDLAAKVGAKYETARKWNTRGTVPDDIRDAFDRLVASSTAKRPGKSSR